CLRAPGACREPCCSLHRRLPADPHSSRGRPGPALKPCLCPFRRIGAGGGAPPRHPDICRHRLGNHHLWCWRAVLGPCRRHWPPLAAQPAESDRVTRIIGAILAGGGGTRLGGLRKADIRIGGRRLIDRVADVLADHVDDLVIASGRLVLADLPKSARVVADEAESTMGPLAGMRASAAMAAPDDILVFAAVDTPFLPSDYVERLIAAARGPGAAYAAWGEAFYPTSSAWRV